MQRTETGARTPISLVGLGGAGSRIVTQAAPRLPRGSRVSALNTDLRALEESTGATRVQMGAERTGGLGCGGDAKVGRLCVEDDLKQVVKLVEGCRLLILVAGMGGGTASGGAPAVVRAARQAGCLTLAFVTMPFEFEGGQRVATAREGLETLNAAADAVVVIPQERLLDHVGGDEVAETFHRANEVLACCVAALCNLLMRPGFINLDFADLEALVRHGEGTCALGMGEAEGEARAERAVEALVNGPLLEKGGVIARAEAILVGIMGGENLTVREVGTVMDALRARCPDACRISMGTFLDDAAHGKLSVVALVSESWVDAKPKTAEGPSTSKAEKPRGRRRSRAAGQQELLSLDFPGKGRFKNIEPTFLDGEDLDVPTYVRRGIAIEKK